MNSHKPIIVFDGVCNFCNWWVDFILKRDSKGKFLFTANQEPAGKLILETNNIESFGDPQSVYLYHKGKLYHYSTAAIKVASMLKFPWNIAGVLLIFPRFMRDWIYKWVAKNRYKWFGKAEACRLPQPGEAERFLRTEDDLASAAPRFAMKTA